MSLLPGLWRGRYALFAALYAAAIFWMSHQPSWNVRLPPWPHFDKCVHFVLYAGFGALLARALLRPPRPEAPLHAPARAGGAFGIATLYGLTDEIHQRFVPGRSCDLLDLAADTAGAATGVGLVWLWLRRRSAP